MAVPDDFLSHFDEEGRYREGDGTLDVVFLTGSGGRYPGTLHFSKGLCVAAEMGSGGRWSYPDNSPLPQIRFLLDFKGEKPHGILVDQGRIVCPLEPGDRSTKEDFLKNVRLARNLFLHPRVAADSQEVDPEEASSTLARAAVWLTPRSVAGFHAADFKELGLDLQKALKAAVQDFLDMAKQVSVTKPATPEQYRNARASFQKMLEILGPYLAMSVEGRKVEKALRGVTFPSWVVNWDFQLDSDHDGDPVARVYLLADEQETSQRELARFAVQIVPEILEAFSAEGVDGWPHVRFRPATEPKTA